MGRKLVFYIFVKLAFYILEFWVDNLGIFFCFLTLGPPVFPITQILFFRVFEPGHSFSIENSGFIFPSLAPGFTWG